MKRLLLGVVGLMALGAAAPANAADLPARPYTKAPAMIAAIYDWSGFYIGINGGGGSARKCWDLVQGGAVALVTAAVSEGCNSATGGTVGGQIGYRWQSANWVFGVEGQGNWANFKGSNLNLQSGIFVPAGLTDQSKVNGFGLLTGQAGYAWNNVLWYVKGGAAVAADKYTTFVAPGVLVVDSVSETRWGGAIGTGLEVGFAPNWSVGVEYDHLFMGTRNVNAITPAGVFSATDRIKQDVDLGTVRVNYRWGGPVIAKY
jgi:outer membrane immunogenic protein